MVRMIKLAIRRTWHDGLVRLGKPHGVRIVVYIYNKKILSIFI